MRQRSTATAHTTTILRVICRSNPRCRTLHNSRLSLRRRPFFLTLNIAVVIPPFIYTIPLNPPFQRGTWCCSRYHHIHTTLTKDRVKEFKEFREFREYSEKTFISLTSLISLYSLFVVQSFDC